MMIFFPIRSSIDFSDWDIDGKELCALSHEDFKRKVRVDPGDLFWTHLVIFAFLLKLLK
jgi:hypothetical protein